MRGWDGKGEIRAGTLCKMAYLILKWKKFFGAKKEKKKNNARIFENNKKTLVIPAQITPGRDTETKNEKHRNNLQTCRYMLILAERGLDGIGNL